MATSSSTDFTLTRNEIIQEALELLGAIGIGDTPTAGDYTTCARSLNMMIKSWNARGVHLWTKTLMSLPLVEEQATYTLSPRPLFIKSAVFRNADGIDRPVRVDSRIEFEQISDKTTPGKITRIYYDPQLTTGTLSVWPVPDDDTETLRLTYVRSLEDFDASSDNADLPQEWLEPIAQNLAVRVASKYGKVLSKSNPDLLTNARQSLFDMELWDTENAKVSVVPARDNYAE